MDIRFPWMAFLGDVRLSQNFHGNVKSTENKFSLRFFGSVFFRGFIFTAWICFQWENKIWLPKI